MIVDVETERRFQALAPDAWEAWWAWLGDVVGGDPATMHITSATLGEGYVVLERITQPPRVIGDEVVHTTTRLDAPTPPPCWPTRTDHP